jgi:hypothetical protein
LIQVLHDVVLENVRHLVGRRKGEAVQHLETVHKLRAVVEEHLTTFQLNIETNGMVVVQIAATYIDGGLVFSFVFITAFLKTDVRFTGSLSSNPS